LTRYLALVDGSDGAWGVRIPDFPGCHGGGATIEAAVVDATTALREFAASMIVDGESIPAPQPFEDIKRKFDEQDEAWGIAVYIPILLDKARPVRANISIDAGLLDAIDAAAKERGLTRSAFLASAAQEKIAQDR
jgi:predicted RNase H-like HicB family nuclease